MFLFDEEAEKEQLSTRIKVIGVGGAGCNAINNMVRHGLSGVEFISANTDVQTLKPSHLIRRIQLGARSTDGQGAGSLPSLGKESAIEATHQIREAVEGAHMVFITAGMGGGTGTGAAPVIGSIARETNALTVGVVTRPFKFEGNVRMKNAYSGLEELKKACHAVIVIPNERLLNVVERGTPLITCFALADDILRQAVQGISDLIIHPGLVNVDFADVKTVMSYSGRAVMGTGVARGDNRAVEAVQKAIANPLLEDSSIEGARGVLINITGGADLPMHEVNEICTTVQEIVDPEAHIIFGTAIAEQSCDEIKVTVITTGFDKERVEKDIPKPQKEKVIGEDRIIYLRQAYREGGKEAVQSQKYDMETLSIPSFIRNQAD